MMFDWFTSDTHYNHANILQYCDRPFNSIEEHDDALVYAHNALVRPWHRVLHLGDFALGKNPRKTFERLHGRITLIRGNHDRSARYMADLGFEDVYERLDLRLPLPKGGSVYVIATHIPAEREGDKRSPTLGPGQVSLHGHVHAPWRLKGTFVHVGVDAWDYAPVPFEEVQRLVERACNRRGKE